MLLHCASLLLVFYNCCVRAQIAEPPVPPQVVSKHAQDILGSGTATSCDTACAQLASRFPSDVVFAPIEINNIWSGQQGELIPACRIQPTSTQEVAITLGVLKQQQCHFAIKSGGHSRIAGASNAAGGVTIDLGQLSAVKLSDDRRSVHVGAGARWADVYRAVEAENLLVTGGRVADVGVGGLLLGGGLSFLANRYGWGCDNVISFEAVLPSGEVATINDKQHSELYRALRGAGSTNFGIITSFELETVIPTNQAGFWWRSGFHDSSKIGPMLDEQYNLYKEKLPSDLDAAFIHAYAYDVAHDMSLGISMHVHTSHGDSTSLPDTFAAFEELEPIAAPDIGVFPMTNISQKLFESNPPPGQRNLYGTFSNYPSRQLEGDFVDTAITTFKRLGNITGFGGVVVMQPIYGNARKLMTVRGGNTLGLASDEGALNLVSLALRWTDAADDDLVNMEAQALIDLGETRAKELNVHHPYKYVNYAEYFQDVWRGLGENNLKGLRQLQRKYDPDGIFTKGGLADGYFKLNEKPEKQKNVKDEL